MWSELEDFLLWEKSDVVAIIETGCHQRIGDVELTYDVYSSIRSDRSGSRDGGVTLLLESDFKFRKCESLKPTASIEGIAVTLLLAQLKAQILVVDRLLRPLGSLICLWLIS